jgi:hypothetical protein
MVTRDTSGNRGPAGTGGFNTQRRVGATRRHGAGVRLVPAELVRPPFLAGSIDILRATPFAPSAEQGTHGTGVKAPYNARATRTRDE